MEIYFDRFRPLLNAFVRIIEEGKDELIPDGEISSKGDADKS